MGKKKIPLKTDFKIIALLSEEKIYKIAWLLDRYLDLKMKKTAEDLINISGHLVFYEQYNNSKVYLIQNRSDNGFLIPQLKQFGCILKFTNDTVADFFLTELKNIPELRLAVKIEKEKLPKKYINLLAKIEV